MRVAAQGSRSGTSGGRRGSRPQGSLFEEIVDLDAVRQSLGVDGCYRVAMEVRETMLRTSRMYRELPLDVFERAAAREIEGRLSRIGHERGLFLRGPCTKIDFR